MEQAHVLTDLLRRAQDGEAEAFFAESYPMLERLARARLRAHVRTPTLDTGALVNEACLRVMRSVIVDLARRRQALRRGGQLHDGWPRHGFATL